jgi:amino acid transporter
MVNVVEEVRLPERTMPRAILLTLVVTMLLYVWIALIAINALSPAELAASDAPLARLFGATAGSGEWVLSLIAITAVVNGVIIQLIMSSRVLYGLSRMGHLPAVVGTVSPATRTPIFATLLVCALIAVLGLTLKLTALATTTSSLTLAAFALVNLSLWRVKGRLKAPVGAFTIPRAVPGLGFVISAGFLAYELIRRLSTLL